MFGIGLPEMIVILAVALIVVGPDKLPELARSLAKGVQELKKTIEQVKETINEEGNVLGDVHDELKKTADDVQDHLFERATWHPDEEDEGFSEDDSVIDLEPLEERPWEKERKQQPDQDNAPPAARDEPAEKSPREAPPPSSPV